MVILNCGEMTMRLSFEEIKNVTVGAVGVSCGEDGVINFAKCTDKQISGWYKMSNDEIALRSKSTTGIRLDFYTDSKSFAFKSHSGDKFELLLDGVIRDRFTKKSSDGSIEARVALCDSIGREKPEVRVTFLLPSHSIGTLEYVELDDNSYIKPCEYSTKILFIGDSITQGWNSYYDSLSYAYRVTNYYDANSVINGVGGGFYEPETFDKIDFQPDTVIIAYGTNDARRFDYQTMQRKTSDYLDLIKDAYGDKKVVVLSPIWRGTENGSSMGEDFSRKRCMVEDEARKRGFFVIEGLNLVPPRSEFYADKYLHPNDLGFGVYAENLIKILNKFI